MKIYVTQSGEYSEYSDYSYGEIFLSEEKAKQYCDVLNKLNQDDYYEYWYTEEETADDKWHAKVEDVKEYYSCTIYLDTGAIDECDDEDLKEARVEKRESFYEINYGYRRGTGHITAYSTKSYKHAKKIAIEQYQIYTQQQLENGEL